MGAAVGIRFLCGSKTVVNQTINEDHMTLEYGEGIDNVPGVWVAGDSFMMICKINSDVWRHSASEAKSLARRFAASSDLLDACKLLLECGCGGGSDHGEMLWDSAVEKAKSAIAKC